jgi:hypothetical protein
MKLVKIFAVVLLVAGCHNNDPGPVGITYLKEMMNIMEENSLNRKTVDWPALRGNALEMGSGIEKKYHGIAITF